MNWEWNDVYCGTPLGKDVEKLGEGSCMAGVKAGSKNKSFYPHVCSSITHSSYSTEATQVSADK